MASAPAMLQQLLLLCGCWALLGIGEAAEAKATKLGARGEAWGTEHRVIVRYAPALSDGDRRQASTARASVALGNKVYALSRRPGVLSASALTRVGLAVVACDSSEGQERLLEDLEDDPLVELAVPDTWVHTFPTPHEPERPESKVAQRPGDPPLPLVALRTAHGTYVTAHPDGSLKADEKDLQPAGKFVVVPKGHGKIALRTSTGKYLSVDDTGAVKANGDSIRNFETFEVIYNHNGSVSLQSFFGLYVVAEKSGVVNATRIKIKQWESFEMINLLGPPQRFPDDPEFPNTWGMYQPGGFDIDAPSAWKLFTGEAPSATSVVVAIIDTGIDYNHEDLKDQMWVNPREIPGNGIDDDGNGFIDDVHGANFVNGSGNPMDDQMHGTHCAGTIAAAGNNGLGIAGVAWHGVRLMALKFLAADGSGRTSDAIAAIDYAVTNGAKIASNSWGGSGTSSALRHAIEQAERAGMLFVAAAGNSGSDNDLRPQYPAGYGSLGVFSVAATTETGGMAWFSCYGKNSVDIAAPGSYIVSTVPNGLYNAMSGTSMACPYVSGVAALLWLYRPELSVAQVRDLLAASVTPLASLRDKIRTGGQVNAWRALHSAEALLNPRPPRQHPKGLAFKDEDPEVGSLSGTVTITAADDESDIEYYRVWFVGSDGSPLQALGKVNATGHSAPVVLPLSSTRLPALAVAMVAVAGNASGEQDFVSSATQDPLQPLATAALVDYVVPKSGPQGVYWFGDEDPRAGQLAGTLWAARATNEHSVSHYNVYWRNVSSRSEAGGQQQGSGGRGPLVGRLNATGYKAPVCSGSSCDLVSVSSSPKGGLRYERSNYTNDEFAVIAFSGPALFILTKLDSEASKDSISVGGQQFSGKPALPLQIMLPAGPSSIVWRSDASISGTGGWSFELVPSNATAQLELLLGTVPLADGLEVAAAYGDTELEAQGETSFLEIPDFDATSQPPSTAFTPSALRFVVDELGEPGTIAGMLRLLPSAAGATCAEGLAAVEFYQLDFADAAGLVVAPLLSKQGLLACSNNSSRWLELKLPPTKLPPQAVQLVARASNRFGIGLGRATFALEDAVRFAPGKAAFSGDEDPARGNIAGELLVWSSSGVQGTLKAYWSDGRSKFEELGELSANGSPGVLSLKIRTPQLGRGILIVNTSDQTSQNAKFAEERFVKVKDWWDAQEHPLHWKLLTSSLARVSSLELDAAGKSQGSAGTEMPVLWSASPQEAAAIQATTKSADGSVFGSMSIKVACDEADFASLAKPASRAALAEVLATSLSSSASATSVLPLRLWIAQAATDHSISTNATTSRAATLTLEFAAVPGCGSESKQLALDHIEGRIILLGLEGAAWLRFAKALAKRWPLAAVAELAEDEAAAHLHPHFAEPQQLGSESDVLAVALAMPLPPRASAVPAEGSGVFAESADAEFEPPRSRRLLGPFTAWPGPPPTAKTSSRSSKATESAEEAGWVPSTNTLVGLVAVLLAFMLAPRRHKEPTDHAGGGHVEIVGGGEMGP